MRERELPISFEIERALRRIAIVVQLMTDGLSEVLWVWLRACAGVVSMRIILLLQETFMDLATECTEKV